MRKIALVLVTMVALAFVTQSASADRDRGNGPADRVPSEVASAWFEQLYDVVKAEGTPPPAASRVYGITAVALYESIVDGTKENRSLVGQLNGLDAVPRPNKNKKYHWPTVANAAVADTIRGLYPTLSPASLHAINDVEQHLADRYSGVVPRRAYNRSVAHGQAVADTILGWAAGDGLSTYANCPYVPAAVPGAWEPTPPGFNPNPLEPCWGQIRPMVLTQGKQCGPTAHPEFSTETDSDFYAAAHEVYEVGRGLNAEQKTIADYWADGARATGTPPGHWIAIVSQISGNDRLSLAASAEAYSRVGIAVHDAFIGCWNAKYVYNLQRPLTYINDNIDASWVSYIVTPSFPAYTSGHSSQSGAAATVLADMFGPKRFVDTTHVDHDLVPSQPPRTFNSFEEAAAEAAVSRLYGGIHFSFDNNEGLTSGRCIGQAILDRVDFDFDEEDDDNDDDE